MAQAAFAQHKYAGLIAAMFYSVFSIAITLFNKALLTTYKFDSTLTLTFLQGLVTVSCLEFMKWRGWVQYPSFNLKTAKQVLPLSIVFVAYVVISLMSLGRVNVPMFTALRRLTVLFVMVEEYFYFGNVPSRPIVNSVAVMTLGAAIAAWKDLSFDIVSYIYLFFTNLFTSLYTVYINVVKKRTNLNVFGMLYYNTITTLPVVLLLAIVTGDWARAWNFKYLGDFVFQINFQASIFLAFLMNVSTFYCTTLNSARTQTVIGQLKNVVPFLLGLFLFSDYIYDHINMLGLVIGFWGGIQYSYVTYRDKADKDMVATLSKAGPGAAISAGAGAPSVDGGSGSSVADKYAGGGQGSGSGSSGALQQQLADAEAAAHAGGSGGAMASGNFAAGDHELLRGRHATAGTGEHGGAFGAAGSLASPPRPGNTKTL